MPTPGLGEGLFFGKEGHLFGVYAEPSDSRRETGIVLCYPFGQEYIRAHRSFVLLAADLARCGFPTLRFDFSGCGDSRGDTECHSFARWEEDLDEAVQALRAATGVSLVAIAGLRLGATVALQWASRTTELVSALALWEPVLDGKVHLAEVELDNRQYLSALGVAASSPGELGRIIGFEWCQALRADIAALRSSHLLDGSMAARQRAIFADGSSQTIQSVLKEAEERGGNGIEFVNVESRAIWTKNAENKQLVSREALNRLGAWLGRTCS